MIMEDYFDVESSKRNEKTQNSSESKTVKNDVSDSTSKTEYGNLTAEDIERINSIADNEYKRQISRINEDPGRYTIADFLGTDPSKYYEELAKKEKNAKAMAISNAIFQGLGTIGDIFTASGGGNVYKRDVDSKAMDDALKEPEKERERLAAAEMAYKKYIASRSKEAADKADELREMLLRSYKPGVTTSEKVNGHSDTETSETKSGTRNLSDNAYKKSANQLVAGTSSNGGGSKKAGKTYRIPIFTDRNNLKVYDVDEEDYNAYKGMLSAYLYRKMNGTEDENKAVMDYLVKMNAITEDGIDVDAVIRSGFPLSLFDDSDNMMKALELLITNNEGVKRSGKTTDEILKASTSKSTQASGSGKDTRTDWGFNLN